MSSTPESLQKIFGHVDANRDGFIENLAEAIRIKSVSASPSNREVKHGAKGLHNV